MSGVDERPVMTAQFALPGWEGIGDPLEARVWWDCLYEQGELLNRRYRLGLRSGWWANTVAVETIAALAAWAVRYDSGAVEDPEGKVRLLLELDRIRGVLRDGERVFHPERDRAAFDAFVTALLRSHHI